MASSDVPGKIIRNRRALARRATDENSAEIAGGGIDAQNLHDGTVLTLPK